jgi:hypothetical protein
VVAPRALHPGGPRPEQALHHARRRRGVPVLTVTSLIGLGASGVVGRGILIVRSPELGFLSALGIALLVIALLSPVLFPWHLL